MERGGFMPASVRTRRAITAQRLPFSSAMPASHALELDLRPATLDDAPIVADLEVTRDPDDPRDPQMLRFWWTLRSSNEATTRLVAERDGAAVAFVAAGHELWERVPERFGWLRVTIRPDLWSERDYSSLISRAETWLRSEGVATSVLRLRGDFKGDLRVAGKMGYREVRRQNNSELDLVALREKLLAAAAENRERMRAQGVRMLTLSDDKDPDLMTKLHEMMVATEQDIPVTVPIRKQPFDEWKRATFDSPATRLDRFWIAREGDEVVGLSVIDFPPARGLPWTSYTATSKAVRGRGIARALKYETIAQAISLGYERVRTANDGVNEPILHINREMGYRLVVPQIELHRSLEP
jgi:GNAT superfamily N-acetyltransferase